MQDLVSPAWLRERLLAAPDSRADPPAGCHLLPAERGQGRGFPVPGGASSRRPVLRHRQGRRCRLALAAYAADAGGFRRRRRGAWASAPPIMSSSTTSAACSRRRGCGGCSACSATTMCRFSMAACPAGSRPAARSSPAPPPWRRRDSFIAGLRPDLVRSLDQMKANLQSHAELVLDARAAGRFDGSVPEPRPGMRSGHIPGAKSLPFTELLQDGKMLPPAHSAREIRRARRDAGQPRGDQLRLRRHRRRADSGAGGGRPAARRAL